MNNTGTIKGVILNSHKKPQDGATIQVDGTSLIAVSDAEGHYRLSNIPIGEQSVTASMVIGKQVKTVDVPEEGVATLNFIVNPL